MTRGAFCCLTQILSYCCVISDACIRNYSVAVVVLRNYHTVLLFYLCIVAYFVVQPRY